jgi:hypothetical protein
MCCCTGVATQPHRFSRTVDISIHHYQHQGYSYSKNERSERIRRNRRHDIFSIDAASSSWKTSARCRSRDIRAERESEQQVDWLPHELEVFSPCRNWRRTSTAARRTRKASKDSACAVFASETIPLCGPVVSLSPIVW